MVEMNFAIDDNKYKEIRNICIAMKNGNYSVDEALSEVLIALKIKVVNV